MSSTYYRAIEVLIDALHELRFARQFYVEPEDTIDPIIQEITDFFDENSISYIA